MCSHWSSSRRDDSPQYRVTHNPESFWTALTENPWVAAVSLHLCCLIILKWGLSKSAVLLFFCMCVIKAWVPPPSSLSWHSFSSTEKMKQGKVSDETSPLLNTKCICKRTEGVKDSVISLINGGLSLLTSASTAHKAHHFLFMAKSMNTSEWVCQALTDLVRWETVLQPFGELTWKICRS